MLTNSTEVSEMIEVKVKMMNQNCVTCTVHQNDYVRDLKTEIEVQTGIPFDHQRVIFRGKMLHNDSTLHALHITDNCCVVLVERKIESVTRTPLGLPRTRQEDEEEEEEIDDEENVNQNLPYGILIETGPAQNGRNPTLLVTPLMLLQMLYSLYRGETELEMEMEEINLYEDEDDFEGDLLDDTDLNDSCDSELTTTSLEVDQDFADSSLLNDPNSELSVIPPVESGGARCRSSSGGRSGGSEFSSQLLTPSRADSPGGSKNSSRDYHSSATSTAAIGLREQIIVEGAERFEFSENSIVPDDEEVDRLEPRTPMVVQSTCKRTPLAPRKMNYVDVLRSADICTSDAEEKKVGKNMKPAKSESEVKTEAEDGRNSLWMLMSFLMVLMLCMASVAAAVVYERYDLGFASSFVWGVVLGVIVSKK